MLQGRPRPAPAAVPAEAPPPGWGPRLQADGSWRLALWSPEARRVALRVNGAEVAATPLPGGWFEAAFDAAPGDAYGLLVDGIARVDPAARWLDGVRGPARLVAPPRAHHPTPGRSWPEAAILELHVGTFTPEGTFAAAAARMADLAALGLTAIQLMPVNAFSGARGWGYDGVFPYAPHPGYGTPADLLALVDAIHAAGMLAFLDVVYNHFGPDGGTLPAIAPGFFDAARVTPWGPAIDYAQAPVRRFFIDNAVMWVRDYGFDGLRLDAVHQIVDPSPVYLIDEMARALRTAVPRPVHLIAEDDRNLPHARDSGTITANWNDDYHHAVHCLLTGEDESYYASFAVDPLADLVQALVEGHVEQGQPRPARNEPRGMPSSHLPPVAYINANQTHDQVGNRARGERLIRLADPAAVRVAHALLLCAPAIPMLFMGEEEGARAPFLFFADFPGDLGEAVRRGRAAEFAGFAQFGAPLPDPLAPETFAASHPYAHPAEDAAAWRALTRDCLAYRARAIVPLIGARRVGVPEVRRTGPRSLHARWAFVPGTLELVAHLGALPDTPVTLDAPDLALSTPDDRHHLAVKVIRT